MRSLIQPDRLMASAPAAAGGWPDGLAKKRKNSESGRSRKRVSLRFKPVLVRRHRAIEGEEIRILAIGLGEQPVAFGIADAARLLGGRIGFGDDDGRFAIGLGPDLLRLLAALGAELGGLALPLGLHALIDRLAVLLRQIGAANTHVDHLDAVTVGLLVELIADPRHQGFALVAHHRG